MSPHRKNDELERMARAAGYSWAENKADRLSGSLAAHDWPDVWEERWAEDLPAQKAELTALERAGLLAIATHAAAERWREILIERRDQEDVEDEEVDEELGAAELARTVARDLPEGLTVVQEAERVYLSDRNGFERTISSLAQAWKVVMEYEELRSLRT